MRPTPGCYRPRVGFPHGFTLSAAHGAVPGMIAFTIEFDNEFEHRIEHHTGNQGGPGVWLTSMVMWSNFMRLIPADGVALRDVEANGRITNLGGLQRWGYISVEPADRTVRLKPGGRRAQAVWPPLA